MTKLSTRLINENLAVTLWEESPQGVVFNHPVILNRITEKTEWWGCFKGSRLLACWPICIDSSGEVHTPDFTYYVGPIFSKYHLDQPNHRRYRELNEIYSSILNELKHQYQYICFCTDTSMMDIRYFLWENHNENKYKITPRYSAQICDMQVYKNNRIDSIFRPARRRQIRKAMSYNFKVVRDFAEINIESVIKLYADTLLRQGQIASGNALKAIKNFLTNIPSKNMYCISIYNEETGELIFFSLILHAKKTANLVLNLTKSNYRETNISNLGMLHAINEAHRIGCEIFDFNGANSPNRSDDKHSYGAESKLFFYIEGRI